MSVLGWMWDRREMSPGVVGGKGQSKSLETDYYCSG